MENFISEINQHIHELYTSTKIVILWPAKLKGKSYKSRLLPRQKSIQLIKKYYHKENVRIYIIMCIFDCKQSFPPTLKT